MKNGELLYFLLVLIYSIDGYNQKTFSEKFKYKATYELQYQSDSLNENSRKSEEMVLYIGDNISQFSSKGANIKDSIRDAYSDKPHTMKNFYEMQSKVPKTNFRYFVYKGIPDGQLTFTEKIVKDNLRYTQKRDLMDWEIHSETKEISGYNVKKASTNFAGRKYIAWFTPEIPVSDGPYKFNGLPGLIMEISDIQKHYSFKLINFKILEEPVIFKYSSEDYIEATQKEFNNAKHTFKRDPYGALDGVGITILGGSENRKQRNREIKREMKKRNNPIELNNI